MINNKKGWIRIIEAAAAILLITGVLLVVIDKGYFKRDDGSEAIYEKELAILREVQLNESLRGEVLSKDITASPFEWEVGTNPAGLENVDQTMNDKRPIVLNCTAKVCPLESDCSLTSIPADLEKDIYAKSVSISDQQDFRQLKLFCWRL